MKVKLEDRSLLSDLVDYLQRCDCKVGFSGGLLDVRPRQLPVDLSLDYEELEVDSYLKVFCALHPGAQVEVVSGRRGER